MPTLTFVPHMKKRKAGDISRDETRRNKTSATGQQKAQDRSAVKEQVRQIGKLDFTVADVGLRDRAFYGYSLDAAMC